jgi:hypothetical protein
VFVLGARVARLCDACEFAEDGDRVVSKAMARGPAAEAEKPSPQLEDALSGDPRGEDVLRGDTHQVAAISTSMPAVRLDAPIFRRQRRVIVSLSVVAVAVVGVGLFRNAGRSTSPEASGGEMLVEPRPASRILSLGIEEERFFEPRALSLVEGLSWVHPVAGTEEQVPTRSSRLFRAVRPGHRAVECGRGHCGVDLDAPRGTPIVSVRPGRVEQVQRSRDGSGGRYVWIRHDDVELRTEYFHLDRIAPDLERGAYVKAGQWLGTLGKTGIHNSEPHLHFAVRDLTRRERYVDPSPLLSRARIIDLLDLRLSEDSVSQTASR